MFLSKGKEVIDLISSHTNKVKECFYKYCKVFDENLEECDLERIKAYKKEIEVLESQADIIRRDIIHKLLEGRMLVESRKSIMRLIEGIDNIADIAEDIIRELYYIPLSNFNNYLESISQVNKLTTRQLELLIEVVNKLVSNYRLKGLISKIQEIEWLESEVDNIEYEIINSIYQQDTELALKMSLKSIVKKIGSVSDVIEDLSDEIEIIIMARKI